MKYYSVWKRTNCWHTHHPRPISKPGQIKEATRKRLHAVWFHQYEVKIKVYSDRTFPVAQWRRLHLPMKETWVWSLTWDDPTGHRATKPVHHNCWVCAPESMSRNYWAHEPQLLKPAQPRACAPNKRSHRKEKPVSHNQRGAPANRS